MTGRPATPRDLDRLAEAYGISLFYEADDGTLRHATDAAKRGLLGALGIKANSVAEISAALAACPEPSMVERGDEKPSPRCFMPDWLANGRCWGVTCQLYSLRSERNWGIGDFADLALLGQILAEEGAAFIGVSPLHALFTADPSRFSPYAPSSRRFLNPLFIAIDWLDGEPETTGGVPDNLRDADLIDYPQVAMHKLRALREAYGRFDRDHHGTGSPEDLAFAAYRVARDEALGDFARFEALSEWAASQSGSGSAGWSAWPAEFRDKNSPAVAAFEADHSDQVRFHAWLQWTADTQLSKVQRRLLDAGMTIGLYLDIAVGVAADGAETWSAPHATLPHARVGAPPDPFNAQGQNWGLVPLSPRELGSERSSLFREMLQHNMRLAGAVRLDHVMALERLFLIPDGYATVDGAYVQYPLNRLLADTAAVSQATDTIVVGEDLGTVRPEFRRVLREAEIQSYRLLQFERTEAGAFVPAADWPQEAMACAATHDLPTLRGWWLARDLDDLATLGLIAPEELAAQRAARDEDRQKLVAALAFEDLGEVQMDPKGNDDVARLAVAVHRHLARTPCRLFAIQLEDLVGEADRANLPGTIDEHPNWRRRISTAVSDLKQHMLFRAIIDAVSAERPANV